ncbi:hypothetical protein CQA66_08385 [Helicobacter aurati]|uniref:Uncharacterized protein n=1 Tax=Helicobacter aurati TaxID=137778 RepID=A0A3D8IZK8_9HELI|nr:hypothetical protein [Helicobacter aurati]RDU70416.1 hypothetical protein CQA66_08385 [Helicobacter aurati]
MKHNINIKSLEKELKKALKKSDIKGIEAGFLSSAKYQDGTQVAAVAYYNNFGTANIPARPFFSKCVAKNTNKWFFMLSDMLKKNRKNELNINQCLDMLGNVIVSDIQESITQLKEPPNKEKTIKEKKSTNPLIDTGLMRKSVTYRLVK